MPATGPRIAVAVALPLRLRVACALALLAGAAVCMCRPAAGGAPVESGGMFLQSADAGTLWKQTVATVASDWPIARIVEPDFAATPPQEGLIESAWVEPPVAGASTPGSLSPADQAWPPRRQRVVVRVMPTGDGAWIDAIVETQSIENLATDHGPGGITLTGGWQTRATSGTNANVTTMLAARMAPTGDPVYALPPLDGPGMLAPRNEPPWAHARFPRAARFGTKVLDDYRNFYSCEGLVCLTAAFGAGALMANTGFDTTMQAAWQRSVVPTYLGTFFTGCKDIGEGRYALGVFGAAAVTGLVFEGRPGGDVVGAVEALAADPSPAVRREAAVALRGLSGRRADEAWASLAAAHVAGDRWETEALGIGAAGRENTSLWDARLGAWLARAGNGWKSPAGREIVWRSRAAETPRLLCELIAERDVTAPEALALVRSLDFQDPAAAAAAVRGMLSSAGAEWSEEKLAVVLPELVMRLDPAGRPEGRLAERIAAAAAAVPGTQAFVDIVSRFRLGGRAGDLVALAAAPGTADPVAVSALGVALDLGAADGVRAAIAAAAEEEARPPEDPRRARSAGDAPSPAFAAAARLLEVGGLRGQGAALDIVLATIEGADVPPALRAAAVRGLARTQGGARRLVEMAKEGKLTGSLPQAAAAAISAGPWGDVRQAAADVLPLPRARGGAALPPVAELVKRGGSAEKGKGVFAGAGTCAKCHVVAGEGKMVGPDLSGVGAKLPREALWESVLAPSAAISHNYEAFTALTHDGRAISGLLVSRTAAEVVIRGADGADTAVAAADLEDLVRQPVSLMPADLASTLTAEELVDLVAYLETLRGAK